MIHRGRPNLLIVEGYTDLNTVVGIMRKHTSWPDTKERAPVWISRGGSVNEILRYSNVQAVLATRELCNLGLIVDANSSCAGRYESIRRQFSEYFPNMPDQIPRHGFVVENEAGIRFGAWIMPDNHSPGAVEDFLIGLVPQRGTVLMERTVKHVESLTTIAPFRRPHVHKARLYSWLALQDPPTLDPLKALYTGALDAEHANATEFVDWFLELYQLDRLSGPTARSVHVS